MSGTGCDYDSQWRAFVSNAQDSTNKRCSDDHLGIEWGVALAGGSRSHPCHPHPARPAGTSPIKGSSMTCNNSGIVQTSFHIANGLFVGVTPDRKLVQIIKTDGPSPYEGGRVLFSQEFPSEVFISAFLATSRTGNTDDWWVLFAHWCGELDMFKQERDAVLRALTRMPKVDDPVIGAVYRDRQKSRVIATVTDNPGSKDCVHRGNGAYGMLVDTGKSDGFGARLRCDYCTYAAHTVTLQCRHEWVTAAFFPHNMEQRYRCRLCGQSMSTGGCALDDPRRSDPAERLDVTNTTHPEGGSR